jgi:hypothetical protein
MKKFFLLCLLVVFSAYSVGDNSLHWNSWKILVPATLFMGIAGCTFGWIKFNSFNKKAGIVITNFQDTRLAFMIYVGMQLGKLNVMSNKNWGYVIHTVPILRKKARYRSAIGYGILAAKKANPQTVYKDAYDGIIKKQKEIQKKWGDSDELLGI